MLIKTVSYERCEFGMRNNTLPKHYENGQIAAIITAELAFTKCAIKANNCQLGLSKGGGGTIQQQKNQLEDGFVFLMRTQFFQVLVNQVEEQFTIV